MEDVMSVLKRILCAIDFDEHCGRALARAQIVALRHDAELRLLHVFPSRPESIVMPGAGVGAQLDRAGGALLDALAAMIRERGVRSEVTTAHGDPAFQILQAGRDGQADLIVMATHGRKGVSRAVLGSVTEAVLHATPCPLLIIPARAASDGGSFRRVVCAVDFSPSSSATLSNALAMVEEAYGELTVVNVIDPTFSSRPLEDARAQAEDALERLHHRMPHEVAHWGGLRNAVRFGETAGEILKLAAQEEAHLIVVGAHSRRPAVAAMVGSCTDRIVREAPCPVLAVPSRAPVLPLPVLYPAYA
jgi:nucleotide-binding universal stress UspA family protein